MVPLDFAASWTRRGGQGLAEPFGRGEPQLALAACAAVLG